MIGVVLVAHGDLAQSMVRTVEVIVGTQKSFTAVGLEPSDGLADIQEKIDQAIQRVEGEEGVLVFTDMLGGSPSITCLQVARLRQGASEKRFRMEVVAGMNLPMVLEALLHRHHMPLDALMKAVIAKSRKAIDRLTVPSVKGDGPLKKKK